MTRSNITPANDDFWTTLTGSLHGLSKLLDICLWVKASCLSHCSTVPNLLRNKNILGRNNTTKVEDKKP